MPRIPIIRLLGTAGGAAVTYQYSRPASDVTDGGWYNELGSQTNLYASVDEVTVSDTDFIYTTATGNPVTLGLGAISDPTVHTSHIVRYRARGNGVADLVATLLNGSTTIATWTESAVAATYTDFSHTLTTGEAATITDYGDLRIKFEAQ